MIKDKSLPIIISELRYFFEREGCNTSSSIAKVTGVNQSQVYRNLFGAPKRITKTHERLCRYANICVSDKKIDPKSSATLMHALTLTWDGSDEHAFQLAELLFAHHNASMRQWNYVKGFKG